MKVVVTGGSGFLGSHVADVLAEAEHMTSILDMNPTGRHPYIVADLLDAEAMARAFEGADAVFHLAAIGDVYLAAEQPALAASVNVTGTANVCDAALAAKVGRVVVASTWEVYGEPRYQPIDEHHPCEPDHPYNITKLSGERLARAYAHLRGLDVVALRLGTAYGSRMRPNSVFSIFIGRALRGEPITIQGSGAQGRQFTHARDIGRAFESALRRGTTGAAYNIVAERMVTIRQLAELVTRWAPTELTYGDPRPGDVPSATVSSALARQDLGWSAETDFESGLKAMVDDARAQATPTTAS